MSTKTLVIAQHTQTHLHPATTSTVCAAQALGGEVHILIAGHNAQGAASEAAQLAGVTQVWHSEAPYYADPTAENLAALIVAQARGYTHVFAPATTFGKNVLPRVAALLGVAQISEITEVVSPDTFVRPIYAGNALATVQSLDSVKVVTVRVSAFGSAATGGQATLTPLPPAPDSNLSRVVSRQMTPNSRPTLADAKVVVSGGRGLGSAENYHRLLEPLADQLNAALGASRAAVDADIAPNDFQVGQTGQIVAPDLYIAIGLSGAIQHLAGMKDSRVIVAINKDPDAPIFQVADYGLVADLFEAVPALTQALQSR